jgi:hypothetical protein
MTFFFLVRHRICRVTASQRRSGRTCVSFSACRDSEQLLPLHDEMDDADDKLGQHQRTVFLAVSERRMSLARARSPISSLPTFDLPKSRHWHEIIRQK